MNQLYVEANKSFKHGFILSEQELRRFNELIKDQIKKINPDAEIKFLYEIKFQNGVVAETDTLDNVLSQENEGSKKLISLHMMGQDVNQNLISCDFYNADSDNIDSKYSIKYNIRSSERDWVFVTSSLIEERIGKIKRFNFTSTNPSIGKFLGLLTPLFLVLGILVSLLVNVSKSQDYIKHIRQKYEHGQIKNTNELILQIEERRIEQTQKLNVFEAFYYPGMILGGLILILVLLIIYIQKLYPLYNFCWGDYLEVFNKKENARKTFNTVIIIGLIISVIGGLIANRMKF